LFLAATTDEAIPGLTSAGGKDIFVRKYDLNGTEIWTTQFGTAGDDEIFGMDTSPDFQELFLVGQTDGTFPTKTSAGGIDFFVAKLMVTTDPVELLEALIDLVEDNNLQQGIDNSLDKKLDTARKAVLDLNANNDIAAINALEAFINEVEAQRGNKISEADADVFIEAAQEIIDLLNNS
jgi:hypothetical protein